MIASIFAGDRSWIVPAIVIGIIGLALAVLLRRRHLAELKLATTCRIIGWTILAACLVNPLISTAKPRPGANVLAVVTDISRSQQVQTDDDITRANQFADALNAGEQVEQNGWLHRLAQDFELQRYTVSDRLQRTNTFENQSFDAPASNLNTALSQLQQRFEGQPLAGVIFLTDGNATDSAIDLETLKSFAPVYPVIVPKDSAAADVSIGRVTVSQTAFDDAPVSLNVQVAASNTADQLVKVTLLDNAGVPLESQTRPANDESPLKFETRPDVGGTVFYNVRTELLDEEGKPIDGEVATANNKRLIAVDRGGRKRRVLYVSGRPNWEYKFLRRAIETDPQTQLVGLIRIARKEARFDFRGHAGESSNSLFRGFDETEQELAEDFDEPVMVRLGTEDEAELAGGFPEDPEELFQYDAIIIDDLEAAFFLADQLQLIYEFVAKRGGGLLMMGGQESFRQGEYARTPIGELLPIDLHRSVASPGGPVSLKLTREGWLQPWVRLRPNETAEEKRLGQMPPFVTINPSESYRPGAILMATVVDSTGVEFPALVTQRFGRGRSAALCIGDLWRWRMNEGRRRLLDFSINAAEPVSAPITPGEQPEEDLNDHARACRQMIRWLVADVPQRLNVSVVPEPSLGLGTVRLVVDLRGRDFEVREDADVTIEVTDPAGEVHKVAAEPSDEAIGRFEAVVAASADGAWTANVLAICNEPDELPEELTATVGWANQPDQEEMKAVTTNRTFATTIADATGGQVIELDNLEGFISNLEFADAPLVDIQTEPFWHRWWIFGIVVACFVLDWTSRRRQGLP